MGRAFQAIRDDQIASAYAGISVPTYKMICFTIGSFFTGLAGAAMVHYTRYASPINYTIDESLIMLQMAILGGLGSLPGSIVGTFILIVIPEISRLFYQFRLLFMGILMVVLMLFAPNGLLGRQGLKDKLFVFIGRLKERKQQAKA
jgi:branched-chain amino acid transport system permease protein